MNYIFSDCSKLTQVNISNKWAKSFTNTNIPSTTKVYNVDTEKYITFN